MEKVEKRSKLYPLVAAAVVAAALCVVGPWTIPIGPVPISLVTLVISLAVYLLGAKLSTASVLVYLFIGAVGLPVFSNYGAGLAKVVGPHRRISGRLSGAGLCGRIVCGTVPRQRPLGGVGAGDWHCGALCAGNGLVCGADGGCHRPLCAHRMRAPVSAGRRSEDCSFQSVWPAAPPPHVRRRPAAGSGGNIGCAQTPLSQLR